MCNKCYKIKDILKCLEIENLWCDSATCKFNRTLRRFYLDTSDFEFNRTSQGFTWSGQIIISTNHTVWKVIWFFWSSCCNECLMTVPWCWSCKCWTLKQVQSQKWDEYNLRTWEYAICWKQIKVNIPNDLSNWYVVYQKWSDDILDINEELCLTPEALTALERSILHDYSVEDWDFEKATFYAQMYNQTLKKIVDKDATVPFSVWMWANVYNGYRK